MITEQQRLDRRLGIGGSDVAVIFGLSNYSTPYQLFLEKSGLVDFHEEEEKFPVGKNPKYWGAQLEKSIVSEFSLRHDVVVEELDTIIHPIHEFMRGNLDGYIPKWNHVLEAKAPDGFSRDNWGEHGSDVIPMMHLLQTAYYCAIKNSPVGHIATLIGGNDYREFIYHRDMELENTIIDATKAFWECVQTNTQPEPINLGDLKLLYPRHNPSKTVIADENIALAISQLIDVKKQASNLDAIEKEAKFQICKYLEDAECITDLEGKPLATYKADAKGSRRFLLKGI